jgi:hypothetical protein
MTSWSSRIPGWDSRRLAGQIGGAWLCGSVIMGTVAVVFLASEGTVFGRPGSTGSPEVCLPGNSPICGRPSLFQLTPVERLAVFALVAGMFVSLAVLVWRTTAATWLGGDIRAKLLWVMLVGLGGLAGWSFAAVITFAVAFSPVTQLILGYTCSGLPFALVAGMLLRPVRANVVAVAVSAGLVAAGFVMVAGEHQVYPQNVFTLYASYARYFFSNNGSGLMLY